MLLLRTFLVPACRGAVGVALWATALGACTGTIAGDGQSARGSGSPAGPSTTGSPSTGSGPGGASSDPNLPGGNGPAAGGCRAVSPGPSPVRRLNRFEYRQTVRDLFGPSAPLDFDLPEEEKVFGFDNNAEARSVSDLLVDRYLAAAERLATEAVGKLDSILDCDAAVAGEDACLDRFLDGFAQRAWRRPLEPDERANLKKAFAEGRTNGFADGISAAIQVLLLSPQFLYRVERGEPVAGENHRRLTGWELAGRMSYLLWGSMPDDQLFAAAAEGKLNTRQEVETQARRMLEDPRAARMVAAFADQWLTLQEVEHLEKEAEVYPAFNPEIRGALRDETQALLSDVLWSGDGKLSSLLTADHTFVNGPLAAYYGWSGITGDELRRVPLPGDRRKGLLTHAGILAAHGVPDRSPTSLVFRGKFIREQILCQPIPDPPPGATEMNPPFTAETTARQWSEARQAVAGCGACHQQMDPLGYGFENYDGAGLWRDTDRGQPVDARGDIVGTDVDGPFDGPIELVSRLGQSQTARDCLATQLFRYGHGRQEIEADACTLDALRASLAKGDGDIRALLVALTQTDAFFFYTPGGAP